MRALRRLLRRLGSWATMAQDDERLRAEIEDHLARQTADNVRAGLPPAEARRQAALKFGSIGAVTQRYREERGLPSLESLIQDTRHALRRLRMTPGFTIATIVTLALGIGATTSIFTLAYAVLLKSLAVARPDELYRLGREARCCYWGGYSQDKEFSLVSWDLYQHLRDHTAGFEELAAFSAGEPPLGVRRAGSGEPARSYPGEYVSGNYFTMFGVGAYAGRALTAADDQPGAPPVAVMSHRLWQEQYGSDPSAIGGVFSLNDRPFTVVGVARPEFFGDTLRDHPPDFFLPLNTEPLLNADTALHHPDTHWLRVIGRVRRGAAPKSIEANMRVAFKQWLRSHWSEMTTADRARFPEQTLFLTPGGAGITEMREEYGHWLQILMTASGFVLLIVCANVANLMLVRGMERRTQMALSVALGAPATRLVRQALTESLLLSAAGGMAGLLVAAAGTRLIVLLAFPRDGGLASVPINGSPSMPVLLFAVAVSLATGLAFGVAPAWIAARTDPLDALRGVGRSTARQGSLPRKALVVFQAALSLVLLSSSGLLTATLHHLENQGFGFDQDRRIVVQIDPRLAGYGPDQLTPLYRRIHDTLSGLPGVSAVALCIYSPMANNNWGAGVWVDGRPAPGPRDDVYASWNRVTAGYLDVIGNRILNGRGISEQDTAWSRHVAVINQAFARKFFRDDDPIGRHFGQHGIGSEREYEIVGIAEDARFLPFDLDKPIAPFFFLPEAQHDPGTNPGSVDANPGSHYLHDIVIVTRPGANVSGAEVRQAMASADPDLPIMSIRSLKAQVAGQFTQQRLIARLTSFFGVLSLVLSCVGLYWMTAWNAARRVNEIGVRMALGADRGDVVRLVLRGALTLILSGVCIGLPLTVAAGRLLGRQLYGMNPDNPTVTLAAVIALGVSALFAALLPALRATLISPVDALRAE